MREPLAEELRSGNLAEDLLEDKEGVRVVPCFLRRCMQLVSACIVEDDLLAAVAGAFEVAALERRDE